MSVLECTFKVHELHFCYVKCIYFHILNILLSRLMLAVNSGVSAH